MFKIMSFQSDPNNFFANGNYNYTINESLNQNSFNEIAFSPVFYPSLDQTFSATPEASSGPQNIESTDTVS